MPAEGSAVKDGLIGTLNVFVDPATTAKKVPAKWFWVWPLLVLSIVHIIFGYLLLPYSLQFMDLKMSQRGGPPEGIERARNMAHLISQITVPLSPLFIVGLIALFAWLVLVACSVLGIRARFRDLFSLLAACSLIPLLQYIAGCFVIKFKGDEITTADQLQPAFGLDIFTSGLHGPLLAILNYFSIFQIWHLVVLTLGLSYLTGCSKTKAFMAITPVWLLALIFKVIGSFFT